MKLAEKLHLNRLFPKDRKGVALITVLTVMSLTTILILTFFSLASSEHRASYTYSNGLQAQQVAEEAVNLVIAQIREATTVGTKTAWASQPGSIRQWGDNGRPLLAYKLYSDDQMKIDSDGDGWGDFRNDFTDMSDWSTRPEHYVDLNEPVIRGEKVYYPIVHPAASSIPKWPQPLGEDQDGVEGFSYNKRPARRLSDQGPMGEKAAKIGDGSRDGHVAMPVKWIYQLADGTLGVLSDGNSGTGYAFRPIAGAGNPSAENRIVARFAFWADDETSKLNINTAAGGLAWDVPKAGGELDMNMGRYQPAQHEWQRYPGHPGSTHLIPVLAPGVLDIVNDRDAMEMLFRVVPRIVGGGSESGTRYIDTRRKEEQNGLIADRDPLFPTVDDIIMRSDRKPHEFPDAKGRPIPANELSEYLERSKFFLTANSRAPETNMFNLPRVAIWPIYNAAYGSTDYKTRLTPFDRLLHYCASMGMSTSGNYPRYEYVFKRENADSTTYDYEKIPRNQELYGYLQKMLELRFPGYGGSFMDKYPSQEYLQILTEIFDYIRSTNLHDDSIYEDFNDAFTKNNNNNSRAYTNPRDKNNTQVGHKGHGQVVPIRIGNTKGMGRFYSLGSVQIQVISCAEAHDRMLPKNFGATAYRASDWRDPADPYSTNGEKQALFANFPPHPLGFERPGDPRNPSSDYLLKEPIWLRDLREAAYPPLPATGPTSYVIRYNAAFDPNTWNWQLAFLDPLYADAVMASPTTSKFNREFLSSDAFKEGATRLKGGEQLVQAGLFFNLFTPSIGWGSINPDMEIEIDASGNFNFDTVSSSNIYERSPDVLSPGRFLGFKNGGSKWVFSTNRLDTAWGGRRYGGLMPMEYLLTVPQATNSRTYPGSFGIEIQSKFPQYDLSGNKAGFAFNKPGILNGYSFVWPGFVSGYRASTLGGPSRLSPIDRGWDVTSGVRVYSGDPSSLNNDTQNAYHYDLITAPFKIIGGGYEKAPPGQDPILDRYFNPGEVQFFGGRLTFKFYHGGRDAEFSAPNGSIGNFGAGRGELIQEIELDVPSFKFDSGNNKHSDLPYDRAPLMFNYQAGTYRDHLGGYYNDFYQLEGDSFSLLERNSLSADPGNPLNTPLGTTTNRTYDVRISASENRPKYNLAVPSGRFGHTNVYSRPGLFSPNDIVQSIEIAHGDARIVAGRPTIARSDKIFQEHRYYQKSTLAHSATSAVGSPYYGASIEKDYLIRTDLPTSPGTSPYAYSGESRVPLPFGVERSETVQLYGDFDNGSGLMIDGPYINKPDEGNVHSLKSKYMGSEGGFWESRRNYGEFPYFNRDDIQETGGPAYFSPNRLVSGSGMFGSLPTGVLTNNPWRTLLFRPATSGSRAGFRKHPGGDNPPDHLLMDLFWMPVVEPYAISEPLSTAGKVNINFEIVPFLHIQRSTALRGIFRSEMMLCIPNKWHYNYKHNHGRGRGYHWRDKPYAGELQGKRLRSIIREDDTIDQFFDRFDNGKKIFKSASEICEMHLVPEEVSDRLMQPRGKIGSYTPSIVELESGKYWQDHSLVGDNSRERPYTNIQQRLTSKSNTFLVHYRAQVLKQAKRESASDYNNWNPDTDTVQAEYRGSSIVERYVNPDATDIPDLAKAMASGAGESLDKYYRFRVVNPRRFAP